MLQKIIEVLLKISKTKLFFVLKNRSLADIASMFGYSLTGGLGRLKLGAINSNELTVLSEAIENRNITMLSNSQLLKTLYAVVTFEELFALMGKSSPFEELSGSVAELLTFDEFLGLIDSYVGPEQNLLKEKA